MGVVGDNAHGPRTKKVFLLLFVHKKKPSFTLAAASSGVCSFSDSACSPVLNSGSSASCTARDRATRDCPASAGGDHPHLIMRLAGGQTVAAGMLGMLGALIDDLEQRGLEGGFEEFLNPLISVFHNRQYPRSRSVLLIRVKRAH